MLKKSVSIFLLFVFFVGLGFAAEDLNKAYSASYKYAYAGKYDKAIDVLMPYYLKNKDDYYLTMRLAYLNYLKGEFTQAVKFYKSAASLKSKSLEPPLGLSLVYLAQKKYRNAESICKKIVSKDFYNYYGNMRLAYVLMLRKKYKESRRIVEKMLEIYPSDPTFNYYLTLIKK